MVVFLRFKKRNLALCQRRGGVRCNFNQMSINQINSGSLNLDFTIQGIASYFNIIDFQGDQINSNALFVNSMPLMLLEHDWQKL